MAIVGSLPVQLANGTLADATQVMSDFNYIVTQVNSNAAGLAGGNAFTGTQTIAGDAIVTISAAQTLSNKTIIAASLTTPGAITMTGAGQLLSMARVSDGAVAGFLGSRSTDTFSFYNAGGGTSEFIAQNGAILMRTNGADAVSIDSSQNVRPATSNTQSFGSTSLRWNDVYSVLGNFSGLVTASGGASVSGGLAVAGGTTTDTLAITAGAIITGSGVNTPVGVTNIQAVVAGNQQWMRVGNVITVSGALQIDPTSGSASTVVALAFPVASTITSSDQVAGTASGVGATVNMSARVVGDTTGHRAFITYATDSNTGNANWSYQYTYIII